MCAVLLPQDRTYSFLDAVLLYHTFAPLSSPFPCAPAGAPPSAASAVGGGRRRALACLLVLCCSSGCAAPAAVSLAPSPARRCSPSGAQVKYVRAVRARRGALGAPAEVCPGAYACAWRPAYAIAASPLGWRVLAAYAARPHFRVISSLSRPPIITPAARLVNLRNLQSVYNWRLRLHL